MKSIASILLLFFVAYTVAPTIISCVSEKIDLSQCYKLIEEENENTEDNLNNSKENYFVNNSFLEFNFKNFLSQSKKITFYNEKLNCNFQSNILIPPPKQI
jgi:hypothetical protein